VLHRSIPFLENILNAPHPSHDTGTVYMAEGLPAQPHLKTRFLKLGLAIGCGLVAGWLLQMAHTHWKSTQTISLNAPAASVWMQPSAIGVPPAVVATAPVMGAELLIDGQAYRLDQGPISLPSGTRFQIRAVSPYAGHLLLSALQSPGQHNHTLWQTPVYRGQVVTTPRLKLEGPKGRETLTVVIQPATVGQQPVVRQIDLWHY
jgi:hypothetical protein